MKRRAWGLVLAGGLLLSACAPAPIGRGTPGPITPAHSGSTASQAGTAPATGPGSAASPRRDDCLTAASSLSLSERVRLLYMGAITASTPSQAEAQLTGQGTGSVILMADPGSASATAELTAALHDVDPGLLVTTDQEGGEVQRLSGPGFAAIPAAARQAGEQLDTLAGQWAGWGGQLRTAGVQYDLAPVADLVPAANLAANAPIGQLDRGYGATRGDVVANAGAVITGLHTAGVATTVKHFPGLGEVTVNTDLGIAHDSVTTAGSEETQVFADLLPKTDSVMVDSVIYDRIDPANPAMFSPAIVQGLLRDKLGFTKVVISDDLGAAKALDAYPVARRGTLFLRAGGDLALDVDPGSVQEMMADTLATARKDPAFSSQLAVKAARVLTLKQSIGLASCTV